MMNKTQDALFFCEKLKTFMNDDKVVVYLLADCYFQDENYVKVNYILLTNEVSNYDENFVILFAKAWIKLKDHT